MALSTVVVSFPAPKAKKEALLASIAAASATISCLTIGERSAGPISLAI
jgi:hypothetical protein